MLQMLQTFGHMTDNYPLVQFDPYPTQHIRGDCGDGHGDAMSQIPDILW
jgi:hypothetical protein